MAHRCNRCRTEYESGGFYNGQDYCSGCMIALKAQDDKKKREIEERKQKEMDDRRKLIKENLIRETERKYKEQKEELKRRRVAEEMRRREMQKATDQLEAQKKRKKRELMHLQSFGRPGSSNFSYSGTGQSAYDANAIIPLGQQHSARHKPARAEKKEARSTRDWPSHSSGDFRIEGEGAAQHHEYSFSLSVKEGLPKGLKAGAAVRIVLVGKNASAKRAEVELFVSPLSGSARASVEIEPKKRFIEAAGEAKFEVAVTPDKDADGPLALEAYIKENAYYIDPEQGKSEVIRLESKVK